MTGGRRRGGDERDASEPTHGDRPGEPPAADAGPAARPARRAARDLPARRRDRHAAAHGAPRLPDRRLVVLATRPQPALDLQGDLQRHGLNWSSFAPAAITSGWDTTDRPRYNLQQTLLLTTPLILRASPSRSRSAAACSTSAARASTSSARSSRVWVGSSWAGMARRPAHLPRDRRSPRSPARLGAAIAGFLKATVGAHEVITTIMLNWIAYWVGELPVRARRAAAESSTDARPDLERRSSPSAKLPVFWGDPVLQGAARRLLHRARRARRLLGDPEPHDARLRGARRRLQPGGRALRRHQRRAATTSSRWRSRARSPASPARWTSSAGSSGSAPRHPGLEHRLHRDRGGPARPQHRGRGRLRGAAVRRAPRSGRRRASLDPTVFDPKLAGNLTLMIQGLMMLFIGADVLVLYLWQRPQEARRRTA